MKKSKMLAAFLSMSLAMTSALSVSLTANADDTDIPAAGSIETSEDYSVKVRINVRDYYSGDTIENVDVKVVRGYEGSDEVCSFNTASDPDFVYDYDFDLSDNPDYGVFRIILENLPEEYNYDDNSTEWMMLLSPAKAQEYKDSVYNYNLDIHEVADGYSGGTRTGVTTTSLVTTTTDLTSDTDTDDHELTVAFCLYDKETGDTIEGLDVKVVEYVFDSEGSLESDPLLTFNTSESPVYRHDFVYNLSKSDRVSYRVYVENLPEEYNYENNSTNFLMYIYKGMDKEYENSEYVCNYGFEVQETGDPGDYITGTRTTTSATTTSYSITTTESYETSGDYSVKVCLMIRDYFSDENIENVDVKVVKDSVDGEEVCSFNTSEDPDFVYDFSYSLNADDRAEYWLLLENIPESYNYDDNNTEWPLILYKETAEKYSDSVYNYYIQLHPIKDGAEIPGTGTTTSVITTSLDITTTATEDQSDFFAPMEDWDRMVRNDYVSRTGIEPATTEIEELPDGSYIIYLYNSNSELLDMYVIDPLTGKGEISGGEDVDLPQTGNNSIYDLFVFVGAFLMLAAGAVMVHRSGFYRRKNEE